MEMEMRNHAKWLLALAGLIIGSPAASQETSGGQPDWLSQAKIAAQLEGISVGEAVRRARLQNLAIKQGERFAADPDFAGSWIERSGTTFRVVFAFKGNAHKTIVDSDLAGVSQTTAVRYSIKDLQAERQRLGQVLAKAGLMASYVVRTKENDLVIYPSDATKLRSLISSDSLTVAPFVKIENGPLIVGNQALVQGGGPTTGTRVVNGVTYTDLCTAGFTVTTGGTGSGGTRGISTAGHCTPPNQAIDSHRGLPIGTRMGYQFGNGVDAAWFNNGNNTYTNRVTYQGSYYTITSWSAPYPNPPVNTLICVIKRDGTQPCAYVYNNNVYINGTVDGPYVWMDRCITQGGDSGGPWLYGSVAYGLHKAETYNVDRTFCGSMYTPAASLKKMSPNINVLIVP
jgi:hypothetical protein